MYKDIIITKKVKVCDLCSEEINEKNEYYNNNTIDICQKCGIIILQEMNIPYEKLKSFIEKISFNDLEPIEVSNKTMEKESGLNKLAELEKSEIIELKDLDKIETINLKDL
jgi:vacuolar-type H+-ATPase subunit I/STV1